MVPPKRPANDNSPSSTIVFSGHEEDDLVSTGQRHTDEPPAEDESAGATAFGRLDHAAPAAPARRPAPGAPPPRKAAPIAPPAAEPEGDGATAFVRIDHVPKARSTAPSLPAPSSEHDGATAFVRIDAPTPGVPRARTQAQPPPRKQESAPRKGLQVTLPDEEPPPPKVEKKPLLASLPVPDKKGRRGAWWDEEATKLADDAAAAASAPAADAPDSTSLDLDPTPAPEEEVTDTSPPDDGGGSTVMVSNRHTEPAEPEVEAAPAPRRAPAPQPPRRAPAAPPARPVKLPDEPYRPVPADDYEGHLSSGPPQWKTWLTRAAIVCAGLFVIGVIAMIAGYIWLAREVPAMESVRDYKPFMTSRVVTSDGTLVGEFYRQKRAVVKMDQIPRVLIQAVTSSEDKDFYKHSGVNILAILRAAVVDIFSRKSRIGASTITQQVVKNIMLTRDKTLKRKLKELFLSWRLEKNLSKDDILFLYLNEINFGRAHYGVEEASLYYFGKHVNEIDLGEAALLAGLPQNPTRLNPRHHPENAKRRQTYVLDRMLANNQIDQADHDREVEKPLSLPPIPADPPGAWYLSEVRRQLVAQYGDAAVDTSGWTVEVAMDEKLQMAAELSVQEGLRAVDKRQGFRGAIFKVDAAAVTDLNAAVAKRVLQNEAPAGTVLVADLDRVTEKEQLAGPESIARAASVRELGSGLVYAGVITGVNRAEAHVQLAPGVDGPVPFSTMTWARPFKPEVRTTMPQSPADVLSVGDIVAVRVQNLRVQKLQMSTRVMHVDFSLEQSPLVQGALVAIDLKTREVLALVGGSDIAKSQLNRATQVKRQPGSSFKPFLYAAAIESGKYSPLTKVDDSPEVITDPWTGKTWKPQNFEKDQFDGPITLRKALAESKNTVAVKLLLEIGIDKLSAEAHLAGISSSVPQSYTAALGTGEVGVLEETNAYATLATSGRYADPLFIRKVTTRDGTVVVHNEATFEQRMRPDVAYVTADLMRSVIDDVDGTAHSLSVLGKNAAGKTGTASDHKDGWFVGFTPTVVAGAWVGFDDPAPMGALETGGHCAGPVWLNFMRVATASEPADDWPPPPPGVTEAKVNRHTGTLAGANDPFAAREVFISGTEPTKAAGAEGDEILEPPDQDQFYQQQH